MIPTIETIVENLLAGTMSKQEAIGFLHIHAEDAGRDLRDEFAMRAMQGMCANPEMVSASDERVANYAYLTADAMLAARK